MKKLAVLFAFVGMFSLTSYAQSDWKDGSNEINVGVKPFHFGPTSLQYKAKVSKRNWLRVGITDLRIRDGETGFRAGIEKQRNLLLRSRLIVGLEPGVYFDYDKDINDFSSYNVDLGFPVGVQIHLSKKLLLGFEARPHVGIYQNRLGDDGADRISNFGGGLDFFNGIRTTLGYRF